MLVVERAGEVGGGTRTAELTLPGFRHDVCSAIHPLAVGSPYLRTLPLEQFGLELLEPAIQAAHPLDDGTAAVLLRSLDETAEGLGVDAQRVPLAGRAVRARLGRGWRRSSSARRGRRGIQRVAARFALSAGGRPATGRPGGFARPRAARCSAGWRRIRCCRCRRRRRPRSRSCSSSLGHAVGWPVARGGSQAITEAMRAYLESLGGTVETGREIRSLGDLPDSAAVLFDTTPRQLAAICGEELPAAVSQRRSAASATGRACSSSTTP